MADIWLEASLMAHDFIPAEFWIGNLTDMQRKYLPCAENFAYVDGVGSMQGFISFSGSGHIEALFVRPECQGRGIGSRLLEFAQIRYPHMTLSVYTQNIRSAEFYRKKGFTEQHRRRDDATGCEEIFMSRTRQ